MATAATAIPSQSQYGLTAASLSDSKNKSFVFVKLTEQALLAIEQYVQQSKGPSQKPSIKFQSNSNGMIHVPGKGNGTKFNFAMSQMEGPARSSLECIRQSKNKRTMHSLGKIRYKLKVQATDEIYETTRAKMAAANSAAKLNATKVIKESGPKVGRKVKVPAGSSGASHKTFAGGYAARTQNHNPVISVTAPAEKTGPPVTAAAAVATAASKKGTRIAHSSALLSVPSQQAYPVSNGSRSVGTASNKINGNSISSNKYSAEKKSELKPAAAAVSSPSPVPSSTANPALQTKGYSDLISHWANKPTSPSAPETAHSHKSSHSDAGSSCSSLTSASSPLSADERHRLKSEFNAQYTEYRSLYSTLEEASRIFWRLEEKMKNCAEGSEEWNKLLDTILKKYEELKKNKDYQETKSRVVSLHQKLAGIKRKIQSVEQDNGYASSNRKRFRSDDQIIDSKFDDNNNDRRAKNLSGPLLAV